MLTIMTGKARSGKTAAVIGEIKAAVAAGRGGSMLLVPEQYSHEAEREMCRECGDTLSLYAEVFSFTGLARRVMAQVGGGADKYLDKGGRLLCMALALGGISSRLRVYSAAARKAELQTMLLSAVDQVKAAGVTAEALCRAAEASRGGLSDKLADLALILEAYNAAAANGHLDPSDRLTVLAEQIPRSSLGSQNRLYVDGFVDFTHQERQVLRELMKKGTDVTVCLTMDDMQGDSEIYALSRRAARLLIKDAQELNIEWRELKIAATQDGQDALSCFADNMFSYSKVEFSGDTSPVKLYTAAGITEECEFAAAKATEYVRQQGCRWRDIAIAVRGFEDYRAALESVFRHYGVPLFSAKKGELLSKPLPAMISGAYEIIGGGWAVDDVVSYIRTGLTGLDAAQCDTLENYIFKWQLRASAWKREADWRQHPDGYGQSYDEAVNARLDEINALRRTLAAPLLSLEKNSAAADTALGQAQALATFFEDIKLPKQLELRAAELEGAGRGELAEEYGQLWRITVTALEQCAAILGQTRTDGADFSRLFTRMLSQYDLGSIPVSLDRVSAGDYDRMRRRSIKKLIVLGVSDDRLPQAEQGSGIFSADELQRLNELELDLGGGGESEMFREFSLIYNCLTLPSEELVLCCSLSGAEGNEVRPAFVFNRAAALFKLESQRVDIGAARMAAPAPALTLAANAVNGGSGAAVAAAEYFSRNAPDKLAFLTHAAKMDRGRLSTGSVRSLYGSRLKLSASRADRFTQCQFAYFCQYGLNAKPYQPAGFSPPEIGSFMHYVLENVSRAVKAEGGFSAVTDKRLEELTDEWTSEYIKTEMNDFREKTARFKYLFNRLCRDVRQIVADMAEELRRSDFEPLSFELDFGNAQLMPPIELGADGGSLMLTGIADRVDGWLHEGRLYLRVVDYKTGKKKFSLSDIWYGMGMQMLLYLYALGTDGDRLYNSPVIPAGVMYVPARNALLAVTGTESEAEIAKKRGTELKRSGIVLDDQQLLEAWERGDEKRYIPIKYKGGKPLSDSVASAERFGLLFRHISEALGDMAQQLRQGSIAADPYYKSQQENACVSCDYADACSFADGENGESCRYRPKLSPDKVWALLEQHENERGEQHG